MAPKLYKASAPGNLMLLGEHAVVYGKKAIVAAIDARIAVSLKPLNTATIKIQSRLGSYESCIAALSITAPFEYILAVIQSIDNPAKKGFELLIEAEFLASLGLGSSAAVTVATTAVVSAYLQGGRILPSSYIFETAKLAVQTISPKASGADVAASTFGGILLYQPQPFHYLWLTDTLPLTALYSGFKTPTPKVIEKVYQRYLASPAMHLDLFEQMDACTQLAAQALRLQAWSTVSIAMKQQQALLKKLQVSSPELEQLIDIMETQGLQGGKISGSGLGDCLIAIGELTEQQQQDSLKSLDKSIYYVPARIAKKGLMYEQA